MIEIIQKEFNKHPKRHNSFIKGSWIIATDPEKDEIHNLVKEFGFDEITLRDALDADEVPRIERFGDYDYIFLRFAEKTKQGITRTVPMVVVSREGMVLTMSKERPSSFDKLLELESSIKTEDTSDLVLEILHTIFDDYSQNIKETGHRIQKIVDSMKHHHLESKDFVGFVMIEDEISNFLSALTPMAPILTRLASGQLVVFDKKEEYELEDISLNIQQSINLCQANARRIISVREAYSTISNNSLNNTMKVLTVATLLVAIPNVIFGMYGMNIDLPLQTHEYSFEILIGIILVTLVIILIFLKKRKII